MVGNNAYIKGNMMTDVHNINGTSNRKAPTGYDDWIDFWRKKTGREGKKCKNNDCSNIAKVGGHVQKHGSQVNKDWYITALCYKCNNKPDGEVFSVDSKNLVPIN